MSEVQRAIDEGSPSLTKEAVVRELTEWAEARDNANRRALREGRNPLPMTALVDGIRYLKKEMSDDV